MASLLTLLLFIFIIFVIVHVLRSWGKASKFKSYTKTIQQELAQKGFQPELDAAGQVVSKKVDLEDKNLAALLQRQSAYPINRSTIAATFYKQQSASGAAQTALLHNHVGKPMGFGIKSREYRLIVSQDVPANSPAFYVRPDKISTKSQANVKSGGLLGESPLAPAMKKYDATLAGSFYVFEQTALQAQPQPVISAQTCNVLLKYKSYEFEVFQGKVYVAATVTFQPNEIDALCAAANEVAASLSPQPQPAAV